MSKNKKRKKTASNKKQPLTKKEIAFIEACKQIISQFHI